LQRKIENIIQNNNQSKKYKLLLILKFKEFYSKFLFNVYSVNLHLENCLFVKIVRGGGMQGVINCQVEIPLFAQTTFPPPFHFSPARVLNIESRSVKKKRVFRFSYILDEEKEGPESQNLYYVII
jgi:hypothetical protein